MPDFAEPLWLALLALLPVLAWGALGRRGGAGRTRRVAGAALRGLAVAALVIALAGPLERASPRHADLMFALDVSSSIGAETVSHALDFVNRAIEDKAPEARIGLVAFGAEAATELSLGPHPVPVRDLSVDVPAGGTDIGRALEVAMGALDSERPRRVVLLSDGRETTGSARAASTAARSLGVQVLSVPLARSRAHDEVRVRDIAAPTAVRRGEPFEVEVAIESRSAARGHLVLLRDGAVLREETLSLAPGLNRYVLLEDATEPGLKEYEVIVNSDVDRLPENNRLQAFVRVSGAPRVLYVSGGFDAGRFLPEALEAQGLQVDEIPASALPPTLHELIEHDLVILDNVAGFDMSLDKMEQLERYVRDSGGGLVKLGGSRSYSAGGYYETPVERLLPVTMDVETEIRIPSLAVTFVIDKSGSMSSQARGEEKLGLAKVAALSAIEVLNPLDRVAVLSFDEGHEWSVPATEAGNRQAIAETLRVLGAGGSTDLFHALEEAYRGMREQEAKLKHLIVLSDGLSRGDADYTRLARRILADGITISTVAFGQDADLALMANIAAQGQGRFYHTEDPHNIPRIFTSETLVVSRDLMVEQRVQPLAGYPGEMLEGLPPDDFPPLAGFQRTWAKAAAQVLLQTPDGEPLLAAWRYGLGRSVAFTSDLSGRWGRDWVAWPEFARFAAQMARWTMRHRGPESLLPHFEWQDGRAQVTVDALDRDERFINHLDLRASVLGPRGELGALTLPQIAPGRYRGEFDVQPGQRYYVNVEGRSEALEVGPQTFGLALPYSAEYADLGPDRELLRSVAATTGGRMLELSNASLAAIHAPPPEAPGSRWRIWKPLLLAALLLLLLEVAVRKLGLPESWRRRLAARRPAPEGEPDPAYEELTRRIEEARERHIRVLRDQIYYRPEDPVVRARLYVAGFRRDGS